MNGLGSFLLGHFSVMKMAITRLYSIQYNIITSNQIKSQSLSWSFGLFRFSSTFHFISFHFTSFLSKERKPSRLHTYLHIPLPTFYRSINSRTQSANTPSRRLAQITNHPSSKQLVCACAHTCMTNNPRHLLLFIHYITHIHTDTTLLRATIYRIGKWFNTASPLPDIGLGGRAVFY